MTERIETALAFRCDGDALLGILHRAVGERQRLGVLIVVGGPQYRVGSHRQFVLMARGLAAAGYSVLRFDYRGMGDSEGAVRRFDEVDADIRAALDAFDAAEPGLDGFVIFGLCDAASAALLYGFADRRIAGLMLVNPWVHSEAGGARAYVRHYYGRRLLQASFWRKVAAGEFDAIGSAGDLFRKLVTSRSYEDATRIRGQDFVERMLHGLRNFGRPILLIISGRDLTASEFTDLCAADGRWRAAIASADLRQERLELADHTFASPGSLDQATTLCRTWLDEIGARRTSPTPGVAA